MSAEQLEKIDNIYIQNEDLINKLKRVRDRNLAHIDKSGQIYDSLTLDEQDTLIDACDKLLKIIQLTYGLHRRNLAAMDSVRWDTFHALNNLYSTY
jgi:hypothetical protein